MRRAGRHEDVYQKYIHSTRARRGQTCTAALQTPTNMHTHHHASHAASARGALDDADGTSAAPGARAPAAELPIARAVQVLELEVPARGRGHEKDLGPPPRGGSGRGCRRAEVT